MGQMGQAQPHHFEKKSWVHDPLHCGISDNLRVCNLFPILVRAFRSSCTSRPSGHAQELRLMVTRAQCLYSWHTSGSMTGKRDLVGIGWL